MEPIPLVPREKEKGNNDVSATLKEVFQTFLGRETFPQNVSRNIQKYKIDDIYIKNNARNVQCVRNLLIKRKISIFLIIDFI